MPIKPTKTAAWYDAQYTYRELLHELRRVRTPPVSLPRGPIKAQLIERAIQWDTQYGSINVPGSQEDRHKAPVVQQNPPQHPQRIDRTACSAPTALENALEDDDPGDVEEPHFPALQPCTPFDEDLFDEQSYEEPHDNRRYHPTHCTISQTPQGPLPRALKSAILAKRAQWVQANGSGRAELADPIEEELEGLESRARGINKREFRKWRARVGRGGG